MVVLFITSGFNNHSLRNFTRIYFVALFVGLLFLFTRLNWKKVAIIFSRDISTIIRLFGRLTPYGQSWAKFRLGALGSSNAKCCLSSN